MKEWYGLLVHHLLLLLLSLEVTQCVALGTTDSNTIEDEIENRELIVNGYPVIDPATQFPFVVSLVDERGSHQCGGTLVAWDVVLTAAHCLDSIQGARIFVPDPALSNSTDAYFVTYAFRRVPGSHGGHISHPRYLPHEFHQGSSSSEYVDVDPYDVALLALNRPLPSGTSFEEEEQFRDGLVKLNTDKAIPFDRQGLTIVGWGITNAGRRPRIPSPILQETVLFHIPNLECRQLSYTSARGTLISYDEEIIAVSLCAFDYESPQSDACSGDSGSPLMIQQGSVTNEDVEEPTKWIQVGVHSSNYGCMHPSLPSLNVRISEIQPWIHDTVCRLTDVKEPALSTFPCPPPARHPPLILSTTQFLSLRFRLDNHPTETGFYFQARIYNNYSDAIEWVTIAQAFPGTYTEPNEVLEQPLYLLESPKALEYKFVVTDNEHNGGPQTTVWYERGPQKTLVVVDHGSFFLESPHQFPPPPTLQSSDSSWVSSARRRHEPQRGDNRWWCLVVTSLLVLGLLN